MKTAIQSRPGTVLKIGNDLMLVLKYEMHRAGRGATNVKMRLKNLLQGNSVDRVFDGEEKFEDVSLDRSKFEFLYESAGTYAFMNQETYEQIELSEDNIGDMPLQNAMIELPPSPIKSDTFAMMNAIDAEANKDARIDSMQQGIVSDKTMTKAEAQTVQANANTLVRKELAVKQWFYEAMYFQRWR